jgi:hypothetical protein
MSSAAKRSLTGVLAAFHWNGKHLAETQVMRDVGIGFREAEEVQEELVR